MTRMISLVAALVAAAIPAVALAQSGAPAERRTITVDGRERDYYLQVAPQAGARPLILALHGGTRSAEDIFRFGNLARIAREQGFTLVAPDAIGHNWNDGRHVYQGGFDPSGIDDVKFLVQLLDALVAQGGVDPRRIYVTGASNGGMMAYRLACEHAERFAGMGAVIATMPANPDAVCHPSRPVPLIAFFGTLDPLMPYDGRSIRTRDGQMTEPRSTAPASTDFWARRNGCGPALAAKALPDLDRSDGVTVNFVGYRDCPAAAPVERYEVIGGGHVPPGSRGLPGPLGAITGRGTTDIDSAALIVRFFQR